MSDVSVPNEVIPQVSDLPVVNVTRQSGIVTLLIQLPSDEILNKLRQALELKYPRLEVQLILGHMVDDLETGEHTYTHLPLPTLHLTVLEDDLNLLHGYLSEWCRINELQLNFTLAPMPVLGS